MREYRIFETSQFSRDLEQLARAGHPALVRKLRTTVYAQLKKHPHVGSHIRKLKDYEPDTWRYRIGAWRFFYQIDDGAHVVLMVAASHRGASY